MSEQATQETVQQEAPQSIGLGDLGVLLNIVDLASQRGAFRGGELTQVGAIYDKLNTFLSYVQEQQQAAAEAEAGESEEAPEGEE
jgi:hypothetical protein